MTMEQGKNGEESIIFPIEYRLERSRNMGAYWSRLYHADIFTSLDVVERVFESEHRNHPSDWLRIVKVEQSIVKEAAR